MVDEIPFIPMACNERGHHNFNPCLQEVQHLEYVLLWRASVFVSVGVMSPPMLRV